MTGKINRMITVELDVWEKFQKLFPKEASSYCNEQMRLRVAYSQGDVSGVDVELLKIREREALAKFDDSASKLHEIQEQLKLIAQKSDQAEKQRLESEKAKIEAMSQCNGCGKQMQEPKVEADGEKFCNECWNNQHPKMLEALKRHRIK